MFSVVIPTLQRSPELWPLVEQCAAHPLVLEVLVINNAPVPLVFASSKVRVLQQVENIYVNPAWNLGAREAGSEWLAIINDDVRFDGAAFDVAARVLRTGLVGVVGPDESCYLAAHPAGRPTVRPAFEINLKFGTFMCLRRGDYQPIPEDLLIWGGDDWLFWSQAKPNATLKHVQFWTEMSTTSSDPRFAEMRERERMRAAELLSSLQRRRWWRNLRRPMSAVRRALNTVRTRRHCAGGQATSALAYSRSATSRMCCCVWRSR